MIYEIVNAIKSVIACYMVSHLTVMEVLNFIKAIQNMNTVK